MKKKKTHYPIRIRIQARRLARKLGETDHEQFLEVITQAPRHVVQMALKETEKIGSFAIIPRSKADSFMSRVKYYSKMFGIYAPKQ